MTPLLYAIATTVLVTALATGLITWLIMRLRGQREIYKLNETITELNTTLELERKQFAAQLNDRDALTNLFGRLSQQALHENADTFLKLAQEKLGQFQISAQSDFNDREKSIASMLKPIQEALSKTEAQIREIEKDRKQSFGALNQQIESLARAHENLQGETRNLVTALRRPEVRGRWGELTLKRVVELAGMVEHCDFVEQQQVSTEGGAVRPDMIVRLPGEREIVIDVKTPLDAYLNAIETLDESVRATELERHHRNLKTRVKELAAKNYWSQFDKAPDFVVLFIPGEQFLSAALDVDHGLLETALNKKIIIATPTTLVALLRAVAYGWRQYSLEQNADRIRAIGEELYKRLSVFTEHLNRLGKSLSGATDNFNKAVGSLERNVLPSARKMESLGIASQDEVSVSDPIEKSVRNVNLPNAGQTQ